MKNIFKKILGTALLTIATSSHATTIHYTTTDLGFGSWQYDYSVINDSLSIPIFEFTVDFDRTLFTNLSTVAAPPDWDALVVQTGSFIDLNNGFYDALYTQAGGLGIGETATAFSVQFDWLGAPGSAPGEQFFEIVDATTFAVLDTGMTTPAQVVPVPAAAILFMNGLGLLTFVGWRRKSAIESLG